MGCWKFKGTLNTGAGRNCRYLSCSLLRRELARVNHTWRALFWSRGNKKGFLTVISWGSSIWAFCGAWFNGVELSLQGAENQFRSSESRLWLQGIRCDLDKACFSVFSVCKPGSLIWIFCRQFPSSLSLTKVD